MTHHLLYGVIAAVLCASSVFAQVHEPERHEPLHADVPFPTDSRLTEMTARSVATADPPRNIPYPSFAPSRIIGMEIPFADPNLAHGNGSEVIEAGDLFGDGMNALMARYANIPDIRSNDPAAMTHKTLIFRGDNRTKEPDIVHYEYLVHVGDVNGDGRQNYISFDIDEVARIYSGSDNGLTYEATIATELTRLQVTQPAFDIDVTGNGFSDYLTVSASSLVVVEGGPELSSFGQTAEIPVPDCLHELAIADLIHGDSEPLVIAHCRAAGNMYNVQIIAIDSSSAVTRFSKDMGAAVIPRLSPLMYDERIGHLLRWVWPNATEYYLFDVSSWEISEDPVWTDRDLHSSQRAAYPHYPYGASGDGDLLFFSIGDESLKAKRLMFGTGEYEVIATVELGDHRLLTTERIPRITPDDAIVLSHRDQHSGHEFRSFVSLNEGALDKNSVEYDASYGSIRWERIHTFGDITGNGRDDLVARRSEGNRQQLEIIEGGTLERYRAGPEIVGRQLIREYSFGHFSSNSHKDLVLFIDDGANVGGRIEWFQGPFPDYHEANKTVTYASINSRLSNQSFNLAWSASDVTGNGFADLVLADFGTSTGLYVWEGGPGFSLERYLHYAPSIPGLSWISHYYDLGDLTGNGFSEFVLSNWNGDRLAFYHGRPIESVDFSKPDLIFLRPADITTDESHRYFGFSGIAAGDFDGNGKINVIASSAHSGDKAYHLATDGTERLFIYELPADLLGQAIEPIYRLKVPLDGVRQFGDTWWQDFTFMHVSADIFVNIGDIAGTGSDSFILVPSGPNWTNAYIYVAESLQMGAPRSVLAGYYPRSPMGSPSMFLNLRYASPIGDFTGSGNTEVAFVQNYSQHTRDNGIFIYTIVPEMVMVSSEDVEPGLPSAIALAQNYPNPFNPTTQITYTLPEASDVRLEVFSLMGRRVATLADGPVAAGTHTVSFDASGLASGVYLYRLQTGEAVLSRMMMVVK